MKQLQYDTMQQNKNTANQLQPSCTQFNNTFLNYYTFLLTSLALIGDVVDKHTGVPNSHTGRCCQPSILSTTMHGQMTDKQREGNDKYLPRVKT